MALHALHMLSDAEPAPVPAVQSFPGSDAAGWAALTCAGLGPDLTFAPSLGVFLAKVGGLNVLCDTGIGPGPNAYLGGLQGRLPTALQGLGVDPASVDLVVFTHLHMDHIGWTGGDAGQGWQPGFPKARHVVATSELDFWLSDPASARPHHREAFDRCFRPLVAAGQVETAAPDEAIAEGVSLLSFPGHTPGHSAIRLGTDRATVIAGDIFHCPGQVERPDWSHRADMDPDLARASRKAFIAQALAEGWQIGAGHFRAGLAFGRITATATGHLFCPDEPAEQPAGPPPQAAQTARTAQVQR